MCPQAIIAHRKPGDELSAESARQGQDVVRGSHTHSGDAVAYREVSKPSNAIEGNLTALFVPCFLLVHV